MKSTLSVIRYPNIVMHLIIIVFNSDPDYTGSLSRFPTFRIFLDAPVATGIIPLQDRS